MIKCIVKSGRWFHDFLKTNRRIVIKFLWEKNNTFTSLMKHTLLKSEECLTWNSINSVMPLSSQNPSSRTQNPNEFIDSSSIQSSDLSWGRCQDALAKQGDNTAPQFHRKAPSAPSTWTVKSWLVPPGIWWRWHWHAVTLEDAFTFSVLQTLPRSQQQSVNGGGWKRQEAMYSVCLVPTLNMTSFYASHHV